MTEIQKLLDIMAALRDPRSGCPWDVEQDFASIAPFTLEEAYEVVDVIERKAWAELPDELGDLLLQVVFHAQMAREAGMFDFDDVARAINEKMIRRHPHVFADETRGDAERQLERWESIKAKEAAAGAAQPTSMLDGVTVGLPALQRAEKLGRKAKRVGFDWQQPADVRAQISLELAELDEAVVAGKAAESISHELGDVLFSTVQYARHLGIDPATALRLANQRFEQRFRHMERQFAESGDSLDAVSHERWEAAWAAAKQALNSD
ncbi:MAG: nucleoside triphosphate pyrophosphohydrolase [Pseudomonadota bacterium]